MCGIAGFTGEAAPAVLRAMTGSLAHRGPDDEGFHEAPDIQLGMRRLAIVDPTSGQQPLGNEDGSVWTVFNGEIYNHAVRRRELAARGHTFSTGHSDTEVIVHLYEEEGPDFVRELNGMFGLAVWDAPRHRLVLSRDRLGKKPLYYARAGRELAFASEIKALLRHPGVSADFDPVSLYHYFGLKNTSAPATAYAAVRQLPPGHTLVFENGEIRISRYWAPDFTPTDDIGEDEAVAEIRRLLEDAVRLRMDCDVPYGAYLSGGVDSSTVVSLMSRMQSRPVRTFCLGYEDDPHGQFVGKAQDLYFAREVSRRLGTEHYELIISARQFAEDMPAILAAFDEPFSGTVSTFFLSTLIRQHVKVALSGDGADELFGSYLAHRLAFPMERYLRMQAEGRNTLETATTGDLEALRPFETPEQLPFLAGLAHRNQAVWRDRLGVFTQAERRELLAGDFLAQIPEAAREDGYAALEAEATARDPLNRVLEVDQRLLLGDQVLPFVDRLSMAHSVEVRCPYLDHRLVEFMNHLPGAFKIAGGVNKRLLKRAVADLLPRDLLDRPKEGFVQPIYSWMHGSLKDWTLGLLSELPSRIFRSEAVERLAQGLRAGDTRLNAKIWNLACFGLWSSGQGAARG